MCDDFPARLSEAHTAGARKRTEEIVAWLRHGLVGVDSCSPDAIANAIIAKWAEQEQPRP